MSTDKKIILPELLAPVGGPKQLKAAIRHGADAVYCGLKNFGLRAFAGNFSDEEMQDAINYVHSHGKKLYVTLNIFANDSDFEGIADAGKKLVAMGADAAIVTDPGTITILQEAAPELELHLSTQANALNSRAATFWHVNGIKRIVLARELSMDQIKYIRNNTPSTLELEAFVHGAVCMSYSGRCVISNYLTGRDSNQGQCAQACRWQYSVVEEKRPGQYMPVAQDERGTYLFSAGDICMIEHIPELVQSGLASLKIEGRMKTEYYVASVVNTYRRALDAYAKNPEAYIIGSDLVNGFLADVRKASHRPSDTGFYFGAPKYPGGATGFYQTGEYVGYIVKYDDATKCATVEVRNRMFVGDVLEVLLPTGPKTFQLKAISKSETGEKIDSISQPMVIIDIEIPFYVQEGDMIRGTCRNHSRTE